MDGQYGYWNSDDDDHDNDNYYYYGAGIPMFLSHQIASSDEEEEPEFEGGYQIGHAHYESQTQRYRDEYDDRDRDVSYGGRSSVQHQDDMFRDTATTLARQAPAQASRSMSHAMQLVYTDGSCIGNGRPDSRAGIGAYFGPGDHRNFSRPLLHHQGNENATNQKAEIQAVTEALKLVPKSHPVRIITDSDYVVKSATEWIPRWRRNDFRGVANADYFRALDEQLYHRGARIEFQHVKGHSQNPGNDEADRLARAGADMYRSSKWR
ncbi:ribonuclease H-like domain-containing protein [Blastocladiella britannica]|nr:ribonuclease H-like domain-containing protein [Blastocladiella britannica]